jgi:hypothetical protein
MDTTAGHRNSRTPQYNTLQQQDSRAGNTMLGAYVYKYVLIVLFGR